MFFKPLTLLEYVHCDENAKMFNAQDSSKICMMQNTDTNFPPSSVYFIMENIGIIE